MSETLHDLTADTLGILHQIRRQIEPLIEWSRKQAIRSDDHEEGAFAHAYAMAAKAVSELEYVTGRFDEALAPGDAPENVTPLKAAGAGAAPTARAANSGNYGMFHSLLFRDCGHTVDALRLDLSDEVTAGWCGRVAFHANSCAGMLATHIRHVHEVLALACDEVDPHPPTLDQISELSWSLGELSGLLSVLESIERLGDEVRAKARGPRSAELSS
ncbi:MAG: hypothetical protein M5U09_21160 [Gammaproteobacteria bacterium]|nr:hypothetical protein [Gammaproteobacteria bacterium]